MRPSVINDMSAAMAEVYEATTDRIMVNLARYFKLVQPGQPIPGAFEYQARMLAQMGKVNAETVKIIAESLGGYDQALRNALTTSIVEALKNEEPALRKAAQKGLLLGENAVPPQLTPNQMQAFQAYYKQSADKLNLVNTVMLESTQTAYAATVSDVTQRLQRTQSILNTATGEVVTGVTSYNTAMRDAVRRMVDNGLTGFVDHGGHRWSPEAYVAMDIKTTMFNTARAAVWERNEQYGNDLYQVSSHNGARPLCFPWQQKVISRSDMSRTVDDLDGNKIHVYAQSETSYGQAAGLFGVNCGHYPMVFIPGFSTLKGHPQDEEENAKTYEESQEQRALERKLREEKRDLSVLKAQGASDEEIKAQRERVRKASRDIDDFCDETGRTRRRDREGTPVKATFPSRDSYDANLFQTQTRDQMQQFFQSAASPVVVPQAQNVASQATQTQQNVVQSNMPDSIEKALKVKKGQPISIGEARTGTNPNYKPGDWGYSHNCQRCVQTYELRRRGYAVEAMPKPKRNNTVSWGSEIFENYGVSKQAAISAYSSTMTESTVKQTIGNAPDGARYSVYIKWKNSRSAHVFVAEKENGQVHYIDPQVNNPNCESYFKDGVNGEFRLFRMDDKNLTTDESIIKKTVKKAKK